MKNLLGILLFLVVLSNKLELLYGQEIVKFSVKTYDSLFLPAQVIIPDKHISKTILFINGSTPYDEKGNVLGGINNKLEPIPFKQDFYVRFLDVMSKKGYRIATMAKRSFVYPSKIPRPNFFDLSIDLKCYIDELKNRRLISGLNDLVVVGYSEGSLVVSKLLGILKDQPFACVLLGSASSQTNLKHSSIEDFGLTEYLRSEKKKTDDEIRKEIEEEQKAFNPLYTINEDEFENKYKNSKPLGFGFAPWESIWIDREFRVYDPVPNLLYANIPVLFCIGDKDNRMPVKTAKKVFDKLQDNGYSKASFRVINGEVHQYLKYDVFPIIDNWLRSEFINTDLKIDKSDSVIMLKYERLTNIRKEFNLIPWEKSNSDKALLFYKKMLNLQELDPDEWFMLGVKLFSNGLYVEADEAFKSAGKEDSPVLSFSFVWRGHLKDINSQRSEAIDLYRKALACYPGFPMSHNHLNILIDEKWIEERIVHPFIWNK